MLEYVNCNLCGVDDYSILAGEHILPGEKLKSVKCKKCGLIYINPRLDAEGLSNLYGENFYAEKTISGLYCLGKDVNINRFRNCFRFLKNYKREGGKLLDIGCGVGAFLEAVSKERMWDIYGVEPSDYVFRLAHEKFGDNIIKGTLEEANFKNKSFDVVTLWNVLEHVPDPFALLKEVRRILKDDGLLIIAVPNVKYYLLKCFIVKVIFHKNVSWYPTEHLYHFSLKTLEKLTNKAGFIMYKQELCEPFMCGSRLENLTKKIGIKFVKLLFRLTQINWGGLEVYLIKTK